MCQCYLLFIFLHKNRFRGLNLCVLLGILVLRIHFLACLLCWCPYRFNLRWLISGHGCRKKKEERRKKKESNAEYASHDYVGKINWT